MLLPAASRTPPERAQPSKPNDHTQRPARRSRDSDAHDAQESSATVPMVVPVTMSQPPSEPPAADKTVSSEKQHEDQITS
jgi:hypothetical protein